ncbi:MAG: Uma2 family endonuclease [Aggregatilineales bacterium]
MVEQVIKIPRSLPSGEIVAIDVSEDVYMRDYAESFHEWVDGVITKMSPVTLKHDELSNYSRLLLESYFALKPIGKVIGAPFVMRLKNVKARREPDLQVILNSNPGTLENTYMDGAADICIEVVSAGSVTTDYGEKLEEYERGGVREYWLFDPMRETTTFYRRNEKGQFQAHQPGAQDVYSTPLLPDFKLHVPTLWQSELPSIIEVIKSVEAMLKDE